MNQVEITTAVYHLKTKENQIDSRALSKFLYHRTRTWKVPLPSKVPENSKMWLKTWRNGN